MSEFLSRLSLSPRKKIELDRLKQLFFELYPEIQNRPDRNVMLLEALQKFADVGAITLPARASWERVGQPPLPKWVLLVRKREEAPQEDFSKVPWVPELGFWPELKPTQLHAAKLINDFLIRRRGSLRRVPIKERSLEIFGDEKRLDMMRSGEGLFSGRLQLAAIGAFVVPLPLPYRPADAIGKPLLIVENHNSFWSFGEWNQIAKRYSAVVYGAGEAFRSSGAALGEVLRDVDGQGVLYLGDLDPKGVCIPLDFNRTTVQSSVQVKPALDHYEWLLTEGRRRELVNGGAPPSGWALEWLGVQLGGRLANLWSQGLWVPQESLGLEQLIGRP